MSTVFNIALAVHVLCVIAILAMLLTQVKKAAKKLNPGVLHAALTALLTGAIMVGTFSKANPDEVLNHTKFGVKGLVIAVILTLGYQNVKKPVLKNSIWLTMLGLTVLNVVIATAWK